MHERPRMPLSLRPLERPCAVVAWRMSLRVVLKRRNATVRAHVPPAARPITEPLMPRYLDTAWVLAVGVAAAPQCYGGGARILDHIMRATSGLRHGAV